MGVFVKFSREKLKNLAFLTLSPRIGANHYPNLLRILMITKFARLLCCILVCCVVLPSWGKPLGANKAFPLQAKLHSTHSVSLQWHIHQGHYLYRKQFQFQLIKGDSATLGAITFPSVEFKNDNFFGKQAVLRHTATIIIPFVKAPAGQHTLLIRYQGCSDEGSCYPPYWRTLELTANAQHHLTTAKLLPDISYSRPSQTLTPKALFQQHSTWWTMLGLFGIGLLLTFTPCVLPLLPVLSSIILGRKEKPSGKQAFRLSLSYVLGMASSYAMVGIIIASIGNNIQVSLQTPAVLIVTSLLMCILAFGMFDYYQIRLPIRWQTALNATSQTHTGKSYVGAAIMGALSILILSPCVTPALVGVLAYIAESNNILLGGLNLFILGLGMGTPLLILGTSAGRYLPKSGPWMTRIKLLFGNLLLAVAVELLSRITPSSVAYVLWSAWLLITAIQWDPFQRGSTLLGQIRQALALLGLTVAIGALLAIGWRYTHQWWQETQVKTPFVTPTHQQAYQTVKNIEQVKLALAHATTANKPVLLGFYADWCINCKWIERTVLNDAKVKKALRAFVVLRADVSANDQEDRELQHFFGVIAPPSFLFFVRGQEISSARIVGNTTRKDFLKRLNKVLKSRA